MIGLKRGPNDYRMVLDPARARRRLLMRAALAAGVVLVLLVGLMLTDETPAPAPELDTGPRAQLSLPPLQPSAFPTLDTSQLAEPEVAPAVVAAAAALAEPGGADVAADDTGAGTGADVRSGLPADTAADLPEPPAAELGEPSAVRADASMGVSEVAAAAPAPPPGTTNAAPPDRSGYGVQVGDYAALSGAEALIGELKAQGLATGMQRRVAVGPYPNRAAAEAAVGKLQRERKLAGFVVPEPGGKGLMVQVGVFDDPANADALRRQLASAGFKAQVNGRVLLGPYPARDDAERVLAKLRSERRIEGRVVSLR